MSRKIIGVTVGTPISPSKIENEIKPVKKVNGKTPDENGNIEVSSEMPTIPTEEWTFTLKEGGKVKKTICVTKSEETKTKTFSIVYDETGKPTPRYYEYDQVQPRHCHTRLQKNHLYYNHYLPNL